MEQMARVILVIDGATVGWQPVGLRDGLTQNSGNVMPKPRICLCDYVVQAFSQVIQRVTSHAMDAVERVTRIIAKRHSAATHDTDQCMAA
jgi:hypothetical protein